MVSHLDSLLDFLGSGAIFLWWAWRVLSVQQCLWVNWGVVCICLRDGKVLFLFELTAI